MHIEQGPVLYELGLPLAAVTSINGCVRYRVRIQGMASHAGTTPMGSRRDAATAAAELLLCVERRAAADAGSVGTVGMLEVPNGSINVVPGECRFSLDLRAPSDAQRDALARDVLAELAAICARRGLRQTTEQTMRASAAPSHPRWQQRWERAIAAQGLPPHSMASGAGHDAMKLHEIMPQAMLFVRGQNHGISHNPLETTTSDDIQLAVQAYGSLLDELARESGVNRKSARDRGPASDGRPPPVCRRRADPGIAQARRITRRQNNTATNANTASPRYEAVTPKSAPTRASGASLPEAPMMAAISTPTRLSPTIRPEAISTPRRLAASA